MIRSLEKISRGQAKRIALKHRGLPVSNTNCTESDIEVTVSIKEGTADDGRGGIFLHELDSSTDHGLCWIVTLSVRRTGELMLDGPYSVVWVAQRGGTVVQSGRGSGG